MLTTKRQLEPLLYFRMYVRFGYCQVSAVTMWSPALDVSSFLM